MDWFESRPVAKAVCLLAWTPHFLLLRFVFRVIWPTAPDDIGALNALLAATFVVIELHLFDKLTGDESLTFDWSQRASRIGLYGFGLAYLLAFGLLFVSLRDRHRVEQMREQEKRDGDPRALARQAETISKSIDADTNRKIMEEAQRRKQR